LCVENGILICVVVNSFMPHLTGLKTVLTPYASHAPVPIPALGLKHRTWYAYLLLEYAAHSRPCDTMMPLTSLRIAFQDSHVHAPRNRGGRVGPCGPLDCATAMLCTTLVGSRMTCSLLFAITTLEFPDEGVAHSSGVGIFASSRYVKYFSTLPDKGTFPWKSPVAVSGDDNFAPNNTSMSF
jgi:hypothetical protein